jgi:DNA-binding MarR family transcriptional regulator
MIVLQPYLEFVRSLERVHRQFLEVVKAELDKIGIQDINNVQTLILFNIGLDELTIGELINRGYYLGSNVSYNVRKMVENTYLEQQRSVHDRRSVRVRLTPKGKDLFLKFRDIFASHAERLSNAHLKEAEMRQSCDTLHKAEKFWSGIIEYNLYNPGSVGATGTSF